MICDVVQECHAHNMQRSDTWRNVAYEKTLAIKHYGLQFAGNLHFFNASSVATPTPIAVAVPIPHITAPVPISSFLPRGVSLLPSSPRVVVVLVVSGVVVVPVVVIVLVSGVVVVVVVLCPLSAISSCARVHLVETYQ